VCVKILSQAQSHERLDVADRGSYVAVSPHLRERLVAIKEISGGGAFSRFVAVSFIDENTPRLFLL